MRDLILHQLVHGYAHGHALLGGSTQLEREDMDLVARLSDLSGALGPGLEISSYLTLYPLPSQKYFAIARTWPDESAPRAGCVFTHTILVPLEAWAIDSAPIRFAAALRAPSRETLSHHNNPIRFIPEGQGRCSAREPLGDSLIQRYFGEGLTPLVWFGALNPESAAWCVIQAMWPSLRARFACCTLSLQPRTLDDRPFDLVFAPPPMFSRFSEFARDHIVDGRVSLDIGSTEPWFQAWSSCVFHGNSTEICERIRVLSSQLEPYPTAIRRVLFFLELEERAPNSPTAALGALDLLETLAPSSPRAQEEKRALAVSALRAIEQLPLHEALELLYLLCQRLKSSSYTSLHVLEEEIRAHVQQLIKTDPEPGIKDVNSLTARHAETAPSLFMLGVADALMTLLEQNSSIASLLIEQSTLGERLIAYRPEIAAALLRSAGTFDRDRVILRLVGWCSAEQAPDVRTALRHSLLREVATSADAPLVEELLRDLEPDDVPQVCDDVERLDVFRCPLLSALVGKLVGERHANSVRQWSRTHSWTSYQAAVLIAAGYPPTADGFRELFTAETPISTNSSLLLAAFIQRVYSYSPPRWLLPLLETDLLLWERLLTGMRDEEVADTVSKLVRGLRRSAIARVPDAGRILGNLRGKGADCIQEHAVRQLLADHFEGFCDIRRLQLWFAESWVIDVLTNISASTVRVLLTDQLRISSSSWMRGWEVVATIPAAVAFNNSDLAYEIISVLLQSQSQKWTASTTDSWRQLLSKIAWGDRPQIELCSQALHYSFEHSRLPLAEVVAETFYPVHTAAMEDRSQRRTWDLWGFTEWDKAKNLRRSLIDSFMRGEWDPAQFALSAREPWLLRKLSKRVLRQWRGLQYLEKAYTRLKTIPSPKAQELATSLHQILQSPNISEEWD